MKFANSYTMKRSWIIDNLAKVKEALSDVDQKIDDGDVDMPWTEDEYEKIQRAHEQQALDEVDAGNTIHPSSNKDTSLPNTL